MSISFGFRVSWPRLASAKKPRSLIWKSASLNDIWKSQTVSKQFKLYSNNYFCLRPVGDSLIHCLTLRWLIGPATGSFIGWHAGWLIVLAIDSAVTRRANVCVSERTVRGKDGAGRARGFYLCLALSICLFSPAVFSPLNPAHGLLGRVNGSLDVVI